MAQGLNYYLVSTRETYRLPLTKRVYFGRGEGCHVSLNDRHASRRHAALYHDGETFVLTDMNSANGTFVNGKRIATCPLGDGDKIEIGAHVYIFRSIDDEGELARTQRDVLAEAGKRSTLTEDQARLLQKFQDSSFSGSIGALALPHLCQMMNLWQRTGLLSIETAMKDKALLYFENGRLLGAEYLGAEARVAAIEILQLTRGRFEFREGSFTPRTNVTETTEYLIMEAMRRRDERSNPPPGLVTDLNV